MRTKNSRLRSTLLLIALAIIAFFPTDMLGASSNELVGTWNTSGMHPSGAFMTATFILHGNSNGSFTMYVNGNLANSSAFTWSVSGSSLCIEETNGDSNCMSIIYVTGSSLSLRTPTGKQVTYSRVPYQVPFGGSLYCCKSDCSCNGWIGGGPNGGCARKGCGHSKVMHADASGCTYH